MKDNTIILWALIGTWLVMVGHIYFSLHTDYELNKHIDETLIEHPGVEELLGPNHHLYITIETKQINDTSTICVEK